MVKCAHDVLCRAVISRAGLAGVAIRVLQDPLHERPGMPVRQVEVGLADGDGSMFFLERIWSEHGGWKTKRQAFLFETPEVAALHLVVLFLQRVSRDLGAPIARVRLFPGSLSVHLARPDGEGVLCGAWLFGRRRVWVPEQTHVTCHRCLGRRWR